MEPTHFGAGFFFRFIGFLKGKPLLNHDPPVVQMDSGDLGCGVVLAWRARKGVLNKNQVVGIFSGDS